jgi:hypothetical protein
LNKNLIPGLKKVLFSSAKYVLNPSIMKLPCNRPNVFCRSNRKHNHPTDSWTYLPIIYLRFSDHCHPLRDSPRHRYSTGRHDDGGSGRILVPANAVSGSSCYCPGDYVSKRFIRHFFLQTKKLLLLPGKPFYPNVIFVYKVLVGSN